MPISPIIGAAAIGAGGNLLGNLLGGSRTQAAVPRDLQGLRANQIDLLRALTQPGAFGAGGAGTNFFGPLSAPRTGIEQFLQQPAPEQRAFDVSRPILEGMLTGTGPQFERDISLANQQGGRFGSANAILRGEALRNLFNQRTQTAQTLGMLAGQAGQNPFQRLLQGFGVADLETQRRLQLMQGLLGTAQGAAFNVPSQQQPNVGQAIGGAGMGIAQLLAVLQMLGGQGGGARPQPNTGTTGIAGFGGGFPIPGR